MSNELARPSWRLWIALGFALYGLNLLLSVYNVWPTPWVTTRHQLSIEILVLVLLMAVFTAAGRPPARRTLTALAALVLLLTLGRYAEVTAPALYGRRINLYWDAPHIPGVAAMLIQAASGRQLLLAGLGLVGGLTALFFGIRWMLARTVTALRYTWPRRMTTGVSLVLVLLFVAGRIDRDLSVRKWFSLPVTQTYVEQVHFIGEAMRADAEPDLSAPPLPESSFARIEGADVLLIFMESYGVTTLDRPEHARALEQSRRHLSETVAQTGRQILSARVTSPTFGSGSWLAHMSLLSGIEVQDSGRYKLLMTRDRETLVHRFANAGYRVLGLMPGIRMAWPEGAFYGYDKIYDAKGLDYRGPEFGWWRIPDQYALAVLDREELAPQARDPVFVVFPTITSHAPFRPVAPYQPDWQAILSPQPFGPEGAESSLRRKPEWLNLGVSYVEAVDYAFSVISGFLEHRAKDDLVLIILGDHQPASSVTGPEASYDVPVHVITSRPKLIQALEAEGFTPGLKPTPPSIAPMHALTPMLLRAFGEAQAPQGQSSKATVR
ncbi:hypothetical protein G3480_17235 [Thiorhodococcus mannitoliphagus]|uniref:Sulfatase-like hydrolase/transferase n=1 Tax=Thiorhodococcus mannitoliphagus TaxID=329406 RepID=A0A6P1DV93_9GAMM|nr:hypothetical protein [Thiorhodococcus mannitoliphagus]NEX22028.1 hypothetical protein [Thiorhodococcus mannitoliphagus]